MQFMRFFCGKKSSVLKVITWLRMDHRSHSVEHYHQKQLTDGPSRTVLLVNIPVHSHIHYKQNLKGSWWLFLYPIIKRESLSNQKTYYLRHRAQQNKKQKTYPQSFLILKCTLHLSTKHMVMPAEIFHNPRECQCNLMPSNMHPSLCGCPHTCYKITSDEEGTNWMN